MNMHCPQNVLAETELRTLAAIPYQLISPTGNSPIIGIYQDSMLGSYRFTRPNIKMSHRDAMNLLMMYNNVDMAKLKEAGDMVSSFDVLSQILPPLTLKYKTKLFEDGEDMEITNNVMEIRSGQYLRGQMEKSVLGSGTKGIIHRVCNDFGNMAASNFIDDLQNVVTEYMKSSSFSVGVSDLVADKKTAMEIIQVITDQKMEVQSVIDQVHLGTFKNNTAASNMMEFETKVNNLLNKATEQSGKIGRKSLSKNNRFLMIVNSGSKGSLINISQMISCLGQQNVDGKRIPYGFDSRTLPHFNKYDDSPNARGFIENSYIDGLTAPELFFHAMGGRIGLIDTACKSVTRDTPIVFIENNVPKYMEIGSWIDDKLHNNKEKITYQTEKNMELLNVSNVYIPTVDEDGIVTWGEVTAVTRHDPGERLYEIKTQGGRSVTVAESQSLLVWDSDKSKFLPKNSPEVSIGEYMPVTAELSKPPIILEKVHLSEYLSKSEYVYGTEFNLATQMMSDAMKGRNHIYPGWWNENNGVNFTLPYSKKSSLQRTNVRSNIGNIKPGFVYPYHANRKDTMIPDEFQLNEENGIFIGLFLAEGNATKNTVNISNNNENIKSFVKEWMNKHSIEPVELTRKNKIGGISTSVIGNSSILSTFLTKMVGSGAENKYVPNEAFVAPESFIIGILNGYFSGDGTVSKNSIEVGSASKRLIEGISMLCNRLGIYGKMFKYQAKKNNVGTKNIKPCYRFTIRAQCAKIFSEKVTLLEENKTKKMREKKWSNINYITKINNVFLDPIVSINVIGVENHPKLYDLTIPSTLNFGLANGLQVRDTSSTGYIQRRLIKGLEDLKVEYDMTVRNSKGKIVQFSYGEDGFESTKVENQFINLVDMSVEDIYMHYDIVGLNDYDNDLLLIYTKGTVSRMKKQRTDSKEICKKYIDYMIKARDDIVESVFKNKNENSIKMPVSFQNIIVNIQGQLNLNANSVVDITPLEAFQLMEEYYKKLQQIYFAPPTQLFEVMFYFYLSPRDLLVNKRFHRKALVLLLETIVLKYKQSIVHPGEMVGVIAGQATGEPTTQLSILRSEKIKMVRVNKTTQIPEMISGEIGTLCDKIIAQLPDYTFDTGHKDSVETVLEPLEDEYYIVGVDEKEKTHWNKISHVSRHIVNGDMIRVTTKSGRTVETTMSHSHLIRKDQTVQPILGSDMEIGMRIPVAKYIDNTFIRDSIEISGKVYKLDHLFGWFIGAYLAEGCLTKKKGTTEANGTISISNVSEYYIENVQNFAARFDRICRIKSKTNKIMDSEKCYTNTDTSFTYKPLADLIMNTCGTGSFVKRVPDFAFLAPNEFKAGLISGYMDGDGNFMCDKIHHQIRVCSRSEQLIKDISLLLCYFDIFGSLHKNYRNGANYYNLAISPKYAEIYEQHIGSNLHTEKLEALVEYCGRNYVYSLREDIDKINGLGHVIASCGKKLELPGQSRLYGRWEKKDSIGRSTLEKYIQIFKHHEKAELIQPELTILRQAANSSVIWDEIVEIERYTPEQTEYVYDFTVPGNQTFMTDYAVIVHNTLNSIIFEEEILVRNSKKEIQKVQIGQFTQDNIKTSTKIDYMAEKDTTYAELSEYYEVPCANELGETVWRRIEAVTQHPVINEDGTNTMLKVTTKGNREVTATKAKSFLQLIDGKIQQVHGKDLKVGDYLPVSRKPLEYSEQFGLNLRDILPPSQYIYGSEIEKARQVVNEYHWWSKHAGKTFTLPYNRSDSAYLVLSDNSKQADRKTQFYKDGFVYTKTNSICNYTIPETIQLDYEFGYLVGAYAAEGCMTKHQVSIANNDLDYLKPIISWCDKHNLTTKIYTHTNKIQEGWMSQDVRIYSTILCRILTNLCGNLSHNKYVSPKIVFSNKECTQGFLDAYIGGDGTITRRSQTHPGAKHPSELVVGGFQPPYHNEEYKYSGISMSSVSYQLLLDVQIMLKNLGVVGKIQKPKKIEKNNRGTLPENIHQGYHLSVVNQQCLKLAKLLNMKVVEKQRRCQELLKESFRYEYSMDDLTIPNIVEGELIMQQRNERCLDMMFDQIISIEEVPNTTNYAYDLTVEDTRNFDIYNGTCMADQWSATASVKSVLLASPEEEP